MPWVKCRLWKIANGKISEYSCGKTVAQQRVRLGLGIIPHLHSAFYPSAILHNLHLTQSLGDLLILRLCGVMELIGMAKEK